MADEVTTPVEPQSGTGMSQQQGENWKARYDGLVRKVEELTLANRSLNEQLVAKVSDMEQLRLQLSTKDIEKGVAISERDTRLQTTLQAQTAMEQELAELRSMRIKLNVIKAKNAPQLLSILDRIPAMTDETALGLVVEDFMNFGNAMVQERERQLLSGVTPAMGGALPKKPQPTSTEGWNKFLNSLVPGSSEHNAAMDEYWTWTTQGK
jgi:hypothetical protein